MNVKSVVLFLVGALVVVILAWAADYFALFNGQKIVPGEQYPVQIETQEIIPESSMTMEDVTIPEEVPYRAEVFVEDLFVPWSIVFTSPGRMLVTERSGELRIVENGVLREEPLKIFDEVSVGGEEGLMGLALDPDYDQNRFLYVSLAYPSDGGLAVKVERYRDDGDALSDETLIIDNIPAAQFHAGCRIKFGPDGKLYITTGDATEGQLAQNLDSLAGKILRLNVDGSIPGDNPFPGLPVYSLGHRNPQGIDWHPVTGTLYSTEHGPSVFDGPAGGDEVNVIKPGFNYGWPIVSHERNEIGLEAPKLVYTPAVAPASGMFYSGDVFPQFRNNFFFALLKGEGIIRVIISSQNTENILSFERMQGVDFGRVREIAQGPDGYIYFTTSNRDGRGSVRTGDDKIYRLVPAL